MGNRRSRVAQFAYGLAFAVAMTCLGSPSSAQSGLRLPFDGSLTGTLGQAPTSSSGVTFTEGKLGMAASFDAGDVLEYASAGNISDQEGTLAFWYRMNSAFEHGRSYSFLAWGGVGGVRMAVDGYPFLRAIFNSYSPQGTPEVMTEVTHWTPGVWRHVAFTWSSANRRLRVYVDGELKAETTLTADLPVVTDPVIKIGSENGYTDANGQMDDLHLYCRESSPFHIAELAKWRRAGEVWAWGGNAYGQVGDGSTNYWTLPVRVLGLKAVVAVSAGAEHSLALKADGTVWSWGYNEFGQLGDATNTDRPTPVQVIGLSDVASISAGSYHSLALRYDGTVWSWGDNVGGQLGDGTTTERWTPGQVPGLTGVIAIAAGDYHSYALKADGTLWAWGYNGRGQIGDGTTTWRMLPVQVTSLTGVVRIASGGWHGVASLADGSVWTWGMNRYGQLGDGTTTDRLQPVRVASLPVGARDIMAGYDHTMALDHLGRVWAWGDNGGGVLGDGTTTDRWTPVQVHGPGDVGYLSGVERIEPGWWTSTATLRDGTVCTWGWNDVGQLGVGTTTNGLTPAQVPYLTGMHSTSGGLDHTLALCRTDYQLWSWGRGGLLGLGDDRGYKNLPTKTPLPGVRSADVGWDSSAALAADGRLWMWGGNLHGMLGVGDTEQRYSPVVVPLSGVTDVSVGQFTLAITSDSALWAWGQNIAGGLGLGDTTDRYWPTQVPLTGVTAASAGAWHSLALTADGRLWAWGMGDQGQLGLGDPSDRLTPAVVPLSGVKAIATGHSFSLALAADGRLWAWGYNHYGNLGLGHNTIYVYNPTLVPLSGVTAIAAGEYHVLARTADGALWAWGLNDSGQLGLGDTTDRWSPTQVALAGSTAISACDHSFALTVGGRLWAWGSNYNGSLGLGDYTDRTSPCLVSLPGVRTAAAGTLSSLALACEQGVPVADTQIVGATIGLPQSITLTGSDEDGDPLSFYILSGPGHGALVGAPPNLVYTSDPTFSGYDSFTFVVNDGSAYSLPATVSIYVAKLQTSLRVDDASGTLLQSVTLRQYDLTRISDGALLSGKTIVYSIDGTEIGTATTDAGGDSTLSWTIPSGPLSRFITVYYAGDVTHDLAWAWANLTVSRIETRAYTLNRTGVGASPVALRGYLYRRSDMAVIGGKTLAFEVAGTLVGMAVTDAGGTATLNWVIDAGPETRQIRVDFVGDDDYGASFATATLTVLTYDTVLYAPDRSGEIGDTILLKGYLYRSSPQLPVDGKSVAFKVDGTTVGSGVTNAQGRALYSWAIPDTLTPGAHGYDVVWPGDAGYRSSTVSPLLRISKGVTYVWVLARSMARGTNAYLRAYVRRLPDYVWLAGKQIRFSIDGTEVGSAATESDGRASLLYTAPPGMTTGAHTITCEFGGDTHYLPNAGNAVLTVTP